MSNFYSHKPMAKWRIVFWGAFAAIGVATIGYLSNDNRLYIAAAICGLFVCGFGSILSWTRANAKFGEVKKGQPQRVPRWVYWIFWIALLASSVVKVWFMIQKS